MMDLNRHDFMMDLNIIDEETQMHVGSDNNSLI